MKKFKKINNEVFYTEKKISQIKASDIAFLKDNIKNTEKKENTPMHSFERKRWYPWNVYRSFKWNIYKTTQTF